MTCKHCKQNAKWPRRGLCSRCYQTPVRHMYPHVTRKPSSEAAAVALMLDTMRRRKPRTPTKAMPGSDEKMAVISRRLFGGQHLWHPDDAQD